MSILLSKFYKLQNDDYYPLISIQDSLKISKDILDLGNYLTTGIFQYSFFI